MAHRKVTIDRVFHALGDPTRRAEESGLVRTEKLGRVRTCRMETAGLAVVEQWVDDRRSTWERKLDRLGDLLAEPEQEET